MQQSHHHIAEWEGNFWSLLEHWPTRIPRCFLGGKESVWIVPIAFSEVSFQEFTDQSLPQEVSIPYQGFRTGFVATVGYTKESTGNAFSRAYRIYRTLVFDIESKKTTIYSESGWEKAQYAFTATELNTDQPASPAPSHIDDLELVAGESNESYLGKVESALEDIRNGRYYQINLLRYFTVPAAIDYANELARLRKKGGPFSSWVEFKNVFDNKAPFELLSYSPERFFHTYQENSRLCIAAEPIKGTSPVYPGEEENNKSKEYLISSAKDQAELHMIVDLMRNDLFKVCQPKSVSVEDPGSLHSFSNVHHLIARVSGVLQENLTVGDLIAALCPGGSITGAPKIEVMKAIAELEGRDRGLFMGNTLVFDPNSGFIDSSILIRSLVIKDVAAQFAAGSGIVVRSKPSSELAEIDTKCRIVGSRKTKI